MQQRICEFSIMIFMTFYRWNKVKACKSQCSINSTPPCIGCRSHICILRSLYDHIRPGLGENKSCMVDPGSPSAIISTWEGRIWEGFTVKIIQSPFFQNKKINGRTFIAETHKPILHQPEEKKFGVGRFASFCSTFMFWNTFTTKEIDLLFLRKKL